LSTRRLLVATRNEGKLRELRQLLDGTGLRLETLASHPEVGEVEETGETFEANARAKASHAALATKMWTVAEDSGLAVDALGGAPGVRSARWSGVHGDDAANIAKLLADLADRTGPRSARFVCAMALARPDGEIAATAHGECPGEIASAPRGRGGFGYDPIFLPVQAPGRTMAELEPDEKNTISHRAQALRAFLPLLKAHLPEMR
jgi:XTP/dITP diphosphohydrolase